MSTELHKYVIKYGGVADHACFRTMPSTTPSKRRKTARLLTSPVAKISVTLFNALSPLLLLRLTWTGLLGDPTGILIAPLLASVFIIQTTFIVLLLPLLSSAKPSKKKGLVKMDTFGEAMRSKAIVLSSTWSLLISSLSFNRCSYYYPQRYSSTLSSFYSEHPLQHTFHRQSSQPSICLSWLHIRYSPV